MCVSHPMPRAGGQAPGLLLCRSPKACIEDGAWRVHSCSFIRVRACLSKQYGDEGPTLHPRMTLQHKDKVQQFIPRSISGQTTCSYFLEFLCTYSLLIFASYFKRKNKKQKIKKEEKQRCQLQGACSYITNNLPSKSVTINSRLTINSN